LTIYSEEFHQTAAAIQKTNPMTHSAVVLDKLKKAIGLHMIAQTNWGFRKSSNFTGFGRSQNH
jgi:hypothetical protein